MERLQNRSWSSKYASHALYVLYQKLQINNKNKFWKTVRLTSVKKKQQNKTKQKTIAILSVSFKSVHRRFHYTILCYYNLFSTSWSVLCVFIFHSIWCQFYRWLFEFWSVDDDSYENVHVILLKQIVLKMCIERLSLNHRTYFVDCLKRQN